VDHWSHALETGTLAGRNMAGAGEKYSGVNRFESEVFDLKLIGWGESRFVDRRLIRGTPDIASPAFAEIGVAADGRVSQTLWIGRTDEQPPAGLMELVKGRANVSGREEQLKDPSAAMEA
jgi:hypothetical protein